MPESEPLRPATFKIGMGSIEVEIPVYETDTTEDLQDRIGAAIKERSEWMQKYMTAKQIQREADRIQRRMAGLFTGRWDFPRSEVE